MAVKPTDLTRARSRPGGDAVDGNAPAATAPASRTTVTHRDLRGRRQQFEARKVRRLIRHVEPWSVLKLSLVFFLSLWLVFIIAAVIVWSVARAHGLGNADDGAMLMALHQLGRDDLLSSYWYGTLAEIERAIARVPKYIRTPEELVAWKASFDPLRPDVEMHRLERVGEPDVVRDELVDDVVALICRQSAPLPSAHGARPPPTRARRRGRR